MFDTVTLQQQPGQYNNTVLLTTCCTTTARLFTGLKNSSFYVKSALSPEGRYISNGNYGNSHAPPTPDIYCQVQVVVVGMCGM